MSVGSQGKTDEPAYQFLSSLYYLGLNLDAVLISREGKMALLSRIHSFTQQMVGEMVLLTRLDAPKGVSNASPDRLRPVLGPRPPGSRRILQEFDLRSCWFRGWGLGFQHCKPRSHALCDQRGVSLHDNIPWSSDHRGYE
jgi:hypothetical protein